MHPQLLKIGEFSHAQKELIEVRYKEFTGGADGLLSSPLRHRWDIALYVRPRESGGLKAQGRVVIVMVI